MQLTLDLAQDTYEGLEALSDSLGFPVDMTAEYAIRLVTACAREGLLADVPLRAWPKEAHLPAAARGKVIALQSMRQKRAKGTR